MIFYKKIKKMIYFIIPVCLVTLLYNSQRRAYRINKYFTSNDLNVVITKIEQAKGRKVYFSELDSSLKERYFYSSKRNLLKLEIRDSISKREGVLELFRINNGSYYFVNKYFIYDYSYYDYFLSVYGFRDKSKILK